MKQLELTIVWSDSSELKIKKENWKQSSLDLFSNKENQINRYIPEEIEKPVNKIISSIKKIIPDFELKKNNSTEISNDFNFKETINSIKTTIENEIEKQKNKEIQEWIKKITNPTAYKISNIIPDTDDLKNIWSNILNKIWIKKNKDIEIFKKNVKFLKEEWIKILENYSLRKISVKKEDINRIIEEINEDNFESAFHNFMKLSWSSNIKGKYQFSTTSAKINILKRSLKNLNL